MRTHEDTNDEANFIVLYSDNSAESREAERMLRETGLPLDIERAQPGAEEQYPTAIYQAWPYKGIDKIRVLCGQIEFALKRAAEAA